MNTLKYGVGDHVMVIKGTTEYYLFKDSICLIIEVDYHDDNECYYYIEGNSTKEWMYEWELEYFPQIKTKLGQLY